MKKNKSLFILENFLNSAQRTFPKAQQTVLHKLLSKKDNQEETTKTSY